MVIGSINSGLACPTNVLNFVFLVLAGMQDFDQVEKGVSRHTRPASAGLHILEMI